VHQLWPLPEDKRWTRMDVIFFHGLQFAGDGSTDAWRSTWTQRGCDLGEDVRILSVSYNAHVTTSPHDHVSEIAHNLFEALIRRCDSLFVCHMPHLSKCVIYQANHFSDLKFITLALVHRSKAQRLVWGGAQYLPMVAIRQLI
jgi:hypothetical protein